MSDEIINFYKKAKEPETPEEPQKPIEEQKETPVLEIPKPDEPFDRFLLELAEKLQKEKVITEKQQETFVEQIKEPVSTDPNENDPFKKFIGSFANILKQDELVNREENIKEATINFINKLKEQPEEPFIIQDVAVVKPKQQKYLPPKIAKKVQKLSQPIKKEEPVVQEQADEPVKEVSKEENTYVKELKTADKTNKKLPEKIKSVSDIKSIVEKQVAEILSRYPNLGFTGGGGGTNAVQYAKGGTMDGDLSVNGSVNASTYLSGGVNLVNILSSSGGGGEADRLISGSESLILNSDGSLEFPNDTIRPPDETILTLESENPALSSYTRVALSPYAFFAYDNEGNSITFDEVDNAIVLTSQDEHEWTFNKQGVLVGPHGALTVNSLSSLGRILSAGVPLHDIFLTAETDAQTLSYNEISELLSISNGNSVSLSSLSDKSYANSNFLRLSGGTVSGNLTVQGNISALGSATFANTVFTTTSALSVVNTGPGPALYVFQAAGPYDVASFYDGDGIEVLHVGNAGPGGLGKVGVNESFPNEELTVRGSISATESIFATSILSGGVDIKDIFLSQQNAKFLPLSGGIITGNTYVSSSNINPTELYQTAISAVVLNTNNGLITLPRINTLTNNQPHYNLFAGYSSESYNLEWDGSQWNYIYIYPGGSFPIGSLSSLDLTQGAWYVDPSAYGGVTSIITQELQYHNSKYISKFIGDGYYINRGGDTVNGSYTINGTVNVNSDFTAGAIYIEPTTIINQYDGLLTFKDTNGNNKWQIKSTDGSGFSIIDLQDNPAPNQFLLGSNGSLQLTWYDSIHTNNIQLDPSQGKISITYLDNPNGNSDQWNEAYTTVQANSASWAGGGGGTVEKRFDFVTTGGIDYSYSGTAAQYTIETSPTWKLIRLTYNNNGTISNQASAINSWTGRLTASYS